MLDTLGQVLFRRLIRTAEIDLLMDSIRLSADLQVIVGAGVLALPDGEDARVLEAAVAGEAHYLVTANVRDFLQHKDMILIHEGAMCFPRAAQSLLIVSPAVAMEVLTTPSTYTAWETRRRATTWNTA